MIWLLWLIPASLVVAGIWFLIAFFAWCGDGTEACHGQPQSQILSAWWQSMGTAFIGAVVIGLLYALVRWTPGVGIRIVVGSAAGLAFLVVSFIYSISGGVLPWALDRVT